MRIRKVLAAVAVLMSFAGGLAAQGRGAARRFTLSGTVVDGDGKPMAGVELTLQAHGWKAVGDPVVVDPQGRFAFGGLAAGEYILTAESGFGTVRYGSAPDPGWVSTIQVGDAAGDKSIVFRIVPRAVVEGVIRDEFGDPMMGINVSLVRPVWRGGRTTMANLGQKNTDDRGRYRFGNLTPGNYVVCVASNQNSQVPIPGPLDYATYVESRSYARTCNRTFQLSPGQRAQMDLTPLSTVTATVRGNVRGLPPQTGFSVALLSGEEGQPGPQGYNAFVDAAQGAFTIRGVPPGRYQLRAQTYANSGAAKSLSAELTLDVGGSNIDDLVLDLAAQATVDVSLQGAPDDEMNGVSVIMRGAAPGGTTLGYAQKKDAAFHFQGVSAGSYRLNLQTPEEICVASVKLGDREMRGAAFDVAAGAALHFVVTVSQTCGAVRMRAVRDGTAVPRAKAVLLLSGTPKDPGEMKEDFVNDEGELTFAGLPAGRYFLWAWAVEGPGGFAGPSSLAAVEQQAAVVNVTAGDPVKVDVPLLTGEGKQP